MRMTVWALILTLVSPACAEGLQIPWKGDYPHNGETIWSPDTKYHKSGLTKNFMNGAPEEGGRVQRDGMLQAELLLPNGDKPAAFVILLHGCTGAKPPVFARWAKRVADVLLDLRFGVLVLDSFTTRGVKSTCGSPNYHWGVRRVEDAYSAAQYLVDAKLAKPDDIFLIGRSNGALTAIMATEDFEVRNHEHHFAATFAISPTCLGLEKSKFASPFVVFIGDEDDAAVDISACSILADRTEASTQVIQFKGVTHGYEDVGVETIFHGWRMKYDADADNYTMATIVQRLKYRDFQKGIERR